MKLKHELQQLKRIVPLTNKKTGQLYAKPMRGKVDPRSLSYRQITLYTLFVSDEGDMMMRPHLFRKKEAKSPQEWRDWLARNVDDIMRRDVLGGLSRITGELSKQWAVVEYIGWVGDAKHGVNDSSARGKRNKTRKKGRARG